MKNLKNKMKSMNGITLIALIITIIILLILAGVTINTLMNNGILDKAKAATQEYKNAQDHEEIQIAKYTNEINSYTDGTRGTVTLTDEEYNLFKSLFSKNGNVSILKPNTWTTGTEYDFGDGLYGKRFEGTITANAGAFTTTTLLPAGSPAINIINWGGQFYYAGSQTMTVGTTWSNSSYNNGLDNMTPSGNALNFGSCSGSARTNAPYDIWIIYTK